MAVSSQPISLPPNSHQSSNPGHGGGGDYTMGSYSGSNNGSFNPASFTRQFIGSPISWRAGSLHGGHFVTSQSPMDHFFGSLDAQEFKVQPTVGPNDPEQSINQAFTVFDREGELCRNYTCCGLHLTDLHALLEHFEEVHVMVVEQPSGQQAQIHIPFNPQAIPANPQQQGYSQQQHLQQQHHQYATPFDVDDMEIEAEAPIQQQNQHHSLSNGSSPSSQESSGALTPPDTPVTTPLSGYSSPNPYGKTFASHQLSHMQQGHIPHSPYSTTSHSPFNSQPPSPHAGHPQHGFQQQGTGQTPTPPGRPNLNLNLSSFGPSRGSPHGQSLVEPFNPYTRYAADMSIGMPGANLEGGSGGAVGMDAMDTSSSARSTPGPSNAQQDGNCVPPALLFSNAPTPESTPSTSRVPSPSTQQSHPASPVVNGVNAANGVNPQQQGQNGVNGQPKQISLSRPAASLLLSSKPFKCPKPGCNKSYKQANGLKYHITHGSCNFAPPKDLEHVQALLERKRRDLAAQAEADGGDSSGANSPITGGYDLDSISEVELREVEREAEKRLRPFACGVGDCTRRYKNMNGLRYHYQHSGEHGQIGLALLASGMHECLNHNNGSRDSSREGRKPRVSTGRTSKPGSRASSLSRTGTPVMQHHTPSSLQQQQSAQPGQQSAPQHFSGQPPTPTYTSSLGAAGVSAQAQLAYQQRFAEHQRAQFQLQQQQHQQQVDQQQPMPQQHYQSTIFRVNSTNMNG